MGRDLPLRTFQPERENSGVVKGPGFLVQIDPQDRFRSALPDVRLRPAAGRYARGCLINSTVS